MSEGITGFRDDMLEFFSSMSYGELQNEYSRLMDDFRPVPLVKRSQPPRYEITYTQTVFESKSDVAMTDGGYSSPSELIAPVSRNISSYCSYIPDSVSPEDLKGVAA